MSFFNTNANLPTHRRARNGLQSRDNLFGLMDDFFKEWGSARVQDFREGFSPSLAVSETPEFYIVEAELPGVRKNDVTIEFQDDTLTLKGEKKVFDEEKKDQYHRFERAHGTFLRSIKFPTDANPDKVSAKMEDGVLRVEIAKTTEPEKQKRTISIN